MVAKLLDTDMETRRPYNPSNHSHHTDPNVSTGIRHHHLYSLAAGSMRSLTKTISLSCLAATKTPYQTAW